MSFYVLTLNYANRAWLESWNKTYTKTVNFPKRRIMESWGRAPFIGGQSLESDEDLRNNAYKLKVNILQRT